MTRERLVSLSGIAALIGLAVVLGMPACGSSSSTGPSPTTTTTLAPCSRNLLFQGAGPLPKLNLGVLPVTTTISGRVEVIVDWTFDTSRIAVYLVAQGTCTLQQLNARTCNFLIRSEAGGAKPRRVSSAILAPAAYEVLIGNAGATDESVSTQIFSSTESCPALGGGPVGEAVRSEWTEAFTQILDW